MKVRTDILRLAKELHTWVGICAGILLFICFFAGGLSMFQHDLSKWATPPQQSLNTVELHQYNDLVLQVQQHYPEAQKKFPDQFKLQRVPLCPDSVATCAKSST